MKIILIENNPDNYIKELISVSCQTLPNYLWEKPIEEVAKVIHDKYSDTDLFIINANVLLSEQKRTDFAGIELLKYIRLYGINRHVILYSFMSREQIMQQDIMHQIIFTKGVSFYHLPELFSEIKVDDFKALINIEADTNELKACFRSEYDPTNRHYEANWWGAWRLWQILKRFDNNITLPKSLTEKTESYNGRLTIFLNDADKTDFKEAIDKALIEKRKKLNDIAQYIYDLEKDTEKIRKESESVEIEKIILKENKHVVDLQKDIEMFDISIKKKKQVIRENISGVINQIRTTGQNTVLIHENVPFTGIESDFFHQQIDNQINLNTSWKDSLSDRLKNTNSLLEHSEKNLSRLKNSEGIDVKIQREIARTESNVKLYEGMIRDTSSKIESAENVAIALDVLKQQLETSVLQIEKEREEREKLESKKEELQDRIQDLDALKGELQNKIEGNEKEIENCHEEEERFRADIDTLSGKWNRKNTIGEIREKSPNILYIDDQANLGWEDFLKKICYNNHTIAGEKFTLIQPTPNDLVDDIIEKTIEKLKSKKPDLLIIDLRLKDEQSNIEPSSISGIQVLKAIKRKNIDCPILVFTASNKIETQRIALQNGASALWTKEGADSFHSAESSYKKYDDLVQLIHFFCCNELYLSFKRMKVNYRKFVKNLNEENKYWWQTPFWKDEMSVTIKEKEMSIFLNGQTGRKRKELLKTEHIQNDLKVGLDMIEYFMNHFIANHQTKIISVDNHTETQHLIQMIQMAMIRLFISIEKIFELPEKKQNSEIHMNIKIQNLIKDEIIADKKFVDLQNDILSKVIVIRNNIVHSNIDYRIDVLEGYVKNLLNFLTYKIED